MLIHSEIIQGTDEWDVIRGGKHSASNASIFVSGESTEGFKNLMKSIAWCRKHGFSDDPSFKNKTTQRGHDLEPMARDWYAFETGNTVIEVGFVEQHENSIVGWSPDGLILISGEVVGAIEIKCLEHKAFLDVWKKRSVPSVYVYQVQWALWVSKLPRLDFVVFHPQHGGIIIPVYPDLEMFARFEERLPIAEKLIAEWLEVLDMPATPYTPFNSQELKAQPLSAPAQSMKTDYEINF